MKFATILWCLIISESFPPQKVSCNLPLNKLFLKLNICVFYYFIFDRYLKITIPVPKLPYSEFIYGIISQEFLFFLSKCSAMFTNLCCVNSVWANYHLYNSLNYFWDRQISLCWCQFSVKCLPRYNVVWLYLYYLSQLYYACNALLLFFSIIVLYLFLYTKGIRRNNLLNKTMKQLIW